MERTVSGGIAGKGFWNYYFRAFIKPLRTYRELLQSSSRLRFSLYAMVINMAAYTLVYLFLIYGDGRPYKPWLNIPEEVYYRYNVFLTAPTMFIGWIAAAGVIHLVTRSFSNSGSFDAILVLLGFSISIASWSTSLHDVLTSFLGAVRVIDQQYYELLLNTPTIWRTILWLLFAVYFAWFVVLFGISVYIVYKPSRLVAALVGTAGFVIYQLFFLVFNR